MWIKETCRSIQAKHDKDIQTRKEWQKQFDDKVWFPPRVDDKVAKEVERIFDDFKIFFEKERRQSVDSEQSLLDLDKFPSSH